jgi:hypothetical protein
MGRTKEEVMFWSVVLSGLGGVASILYLFGIRIGGGVIVPSSWAWLTVAVLLYSLNLTGLVYFRRLGTRAQKQSQDLRLQLSALNSRPPLRWNAPFYCRSQERGVRIESAMFGPLGREPQDVIERVRELADRGEPIFPSFHQLLNGVDPLQHADKYLTVTISITRSEIEGKRIVIALDSESGSVTTL